MVHAAAMAARQAQTPLRRVLRKLRAGCGSGSLSAAAARLRTLMLSWGRLQVRLLACRPGALHVVACDDLELMLLQRACTLQQHETC